jgi:hypothetical protein
MKQLKRTERKELNQPCSMESRILRFAQQIMKNMAHLMEKRHNIVVSHQSRFIRSGFRQIGDHRGQRIVTCIVWKVITSQERPDSSMRIFRLYSDLSRMDRVDEGKNAYREGTDPGSNIRRNQRHLWHLSPKLKMLGHLQI